MNIIEILGYPYKVKFSTFQLNKKAVKINTQKSKYYLFNNLLYINTNSLINLNQNGPKWVLSWENL